MTQPNPDQAATDKAAAEKAAAEKAAADKAKVASKVDVLTVGQFTFHDHILRRQHSGLGVVAKVGQVLTVRPLAGHYVQVDPADFTPLSADDV